MLAGVAGGLGEQFDLDPSIVRVVLVVLALFGGLGLVIYAVLALVVPAQEGAPPLSGLVKVALVAIIIAALCSVPFGLFFVGPGVGVLLVLAALGVLLWRAVGGQTDSRLLRASLLVLAVAGSATLGLAAGVASAFGGGTVIAVLVILCGVGLVVGGLIGGARWLILPALLLALPVSVVSAADLRLKGGVGDREYRPSTVSDIRSLYRLGAGGLTIDLGDVAFAPGQETDVAVRMGAGDTQITVPKGVCVQVRAHAGAGSVDLLGQVNEGVDVDAERGGTPGVLQPVLRLDIRQKVGGILVEGRFRRRLPRNPDGCEG